MQRMHGLWRLDRGGGRHHHLTENAPAKDPWGICPLAVMAPEEILANGFDVKCLCECQFMRGDHGPEA